MVEDCRPLTHNDYTVGWVCALPKSELVVAGAMLDEEHPILPASDPGDTNVYLLGRIGHHNVVIACVPAEKTGTVSAAIVAKDMLRSFTQIRFGLMVGVGGGVPSLNRDNETSEDDEDDEDDEGLIDGKDIRLGDVVVSLHSKDSDAVVQYDFGKSLHKGQFFRTGSLNKPPNLLLQAVSMIQGQHMRKGNNLSYHLSKMLEKNPKLANTFEYQGSSNDRLFKADIIHAKEKKSCKSCCGDGGANLVLRKDRQDASPVIHYGTIGSANQVMKDPALRDKWAEQEKIICFEMEASGLMDTFPCLVIRGICDYADSHKNKIWQPYAAATAAAYAKELLNIIPASQVEKTPMATEVMKFVYEKVGKIGADVTAMRENLDSTREDIIAIRADIATRKIDENRGKIIQWLSTTDSYSNHRAACEKHQPTTGEWLIKQTDFGEWKRMRNSLLWLYGIPGCGKTILSSTIVEHMKLYCEKPGFALAYYYFDFKDTNKQEVSNFISSLIAQLCSRLDHLPENLKELYKRRKNGQEKAAMQELKTALSETIKDLKDVFVVVDALDECPKDRKREELLDLFAEIKSWSVPHLHILVTSRRERDIKQALMPLTHLEIPIQGSGVNSDIKLHIEHQLATDPKLNEWADDVKSEMGRVLVDGANGMFRWVYCQLDALKKCLKLRTLLEALKNLPRTLDDTYTRILSSIDDDYQQEAITALQWLVSSERPLRIDELAEATAVNPLSDPAFDPKERLRDPYCVLQILTSLVTISPKHDTHDSSQMIIELAHFSVKEYLLSDRTRSCSASKFHVTNIAANDFIAKSSLLYILSYSDSKVSSSVDLENFPLLRYACQFWYTHAKSIPAKSQESISPIIFRLYLSNTALAAWLQIHRPDIPNGEPFKFPKNAGSPLYYASDIGLEAVVRLLLERKADVNAKTESGGTALHRAARNGHEEVVRLLLEHKADVNAGDKSGETALHQAAEKGHEAVVRLLLENKADVKAKGSYRETALHRAAKKGHETVVQLLLEHKADVDAEDCYRATALHQAAGRGDKAAVWLLLEHKADVNAKDKNGWTALHLATKNGRKAVVQQLLEHNADVNAKNIIGGTALYWAVGNGHEAVVRLLLEHNADVNTKARFGRLALHQAARSGHKAVVRLLLEHKADVNSKNNNGGTALHWAAENGHEAVVRLMLEYNADVDSKNNNGGTALHWAAENGHEAVVRLMLEHNADVDAKDGIWGWTALHRATKNMHEKVVRLLLEHKADVDAKDKSGGTALHQAVENGHEAVLRLLLEHKADINAKDKSGGTALHQAAEKGHEAVRQLELGPTQKSRAEEWSFSKSTKYPASYGHLNHRTLSSFVEEAQPRNYSLKSKLRRARIHYIDFEYFIPLSDINQLITASVIEQEILKADPNAGVRAQIYAPRIENSARKLFAILAWLQNCAAIFSLLDSNISDQDLPFLAKEVDHRLSLWWGEPKERIKVLDKWVDEDVEEFSRVQWWMIAPIFDKESHELLELADEIVLPFIPIKKHEAENEEIPHMKTGGYDEVTAYRIHPAHHNFWVWDTSLPIESQPLIADKKLLSNNVMDFLKEKSVLDALGRQNHPNLMILLATYQKNKGYHFLFPCADCNLRTYWAKDEISNFDEKTILWSIRQMSGITSALDSIHTFKVQIDLDVDGGVRIHEGGAKLTVKAGEEKFGRHGDIKPENILWFKEGEDLKITDFGLGRFHGRDSRSGIDSRKIPATLTYEPPECSLARSVSRKYDIWSLGCLFLEFVTWLFEGSAKINEFADARGLDTGFIDDDAFFTIFMNDNPEKDAIVREGVAHWVDGLHAHEKCSELIHDLLDLVMGSMLKVEPDERLSAKGLKEEMEKLVKKAEKSETYLIRAAPRPLTTPTPARKPRTGRKVHFAGS